MDAEASARNRDVGERMRKAREDVGLKQSELARACQVSRNAVSMWERGESGIEAQKLIDAAKALRVDVVWLQWGKGERPGRRVSRQDGSPTDWRSPSNPPGDTHVAAMPDEIGTGKAVAEKPGVASGWWSLPTDVIDEYRMKQNSSIRVHRVAEQTIADAPVGGRLFIDNSVKVDGLNDGDLIVVDAGPMLLLKRVMADLSSRNKIAIVDDRTKTPQFVERKRIRIAGKVIGIFRRP
jgi:DNA-binding XRE family transcriptional regulator